MPYSLFMTILMMFSSVLDSSLLKYRSVAVRNVIAVFGYKNIVTGVKFISSISFEGTTHTVRLEEQLAFSDWIHSNLGHDIDLKHLLPIDQEGKHLFLSIKDGIINHSCPDTIDERVINKQILNVYREFENLTLALMSSQAIGSNIVNIDVHDLVKGKPGLVLGLLCQIIRIGLFRHITIVYMYTISHSIVVLTRAGLLFEDERLEALMKLSPEAILLHWLNHHLEKAGISRRCTYFQSDTVDSEIYTHTHLLKQIAHNDSGVTVEALRESDLSSRAEIMLQQAAKLNTHSWRIKAKMRYLVANKTTG